MNACMKPKSTKLKMKLELKSQAQFNRKQFTATEKNAELSFMKIIYEKIIILAQLFFSRSRINKKKSID